MKEKLYRLLDLDTISRCREEINLENRKAISLLAFSGVPLSLVNFIAQLVVMGPDRAIFRGGWLTAYFLLLLFFERRILPRDYPHSTGLLYFLEAPVMLLSILLGTVWDTTHFAVTIMMFIMAMPIFMLDRQDRCLGVMAGWSLLFTILCIAVKDDSLRWTDTVHICEFYLAASIVSTVVMRVRLASLRSLEQAQYHLNHDARTGCLSRYALTQRTGRYLGKPLTLLFCDMDQLKLYSDFYGHDVGDAMTYYFTHTMMDCFGAEHSYRYSGDEILCVAEGSSSADSLAKVRQCREKLHAFTHGGRNISISCAFGYVTGTPKTDQEFQEMIQLADIYAHKVKLSGPDQTLGGPFDQERLRQGIMDSSISSHAHAYETNQLTGLPGMSYFVARADEILQDVIKLPRQTVLGHFKIMRLRDYNSEFGFQQGDALIADTAKLLRKHFVSRQICYISSGEFGIMCFKDEAEQAVRRVSEELLHYRPGFPVYCKAGFAAYTDGEKAISLMDKAKIAQKTILRSKDRDVCFYEAKLDEEVRFQQYVVNHLDEAIERQYLQVYYQPIARATTGEICNEEALSRWDDPHYGFLMPVRFIPILEENGLMYKVNLNVVRQVLRDFGKRKEAGMPIVPVSVNLSRRDFEQCDMVQAVSDMVDASGFPRSMIKIEITESAFISNQELLRREVERFRSAGFEVWLDDFGSEYSILNLLEEIDFDLIKIDMKFMKNLDGTGKNFIIVSDIIDMSRRMGITTLVEGVETREHYRIMQRLGCEKLQGYLFNKPNNLDYIFNRVRSGTGLHFEAPGAGPYYDAIDRINLSAPLALGSVEEAMRMEHEIPSGILEVRQGAYTCLRGNERFLTLLEGWGVLAPESKEVSSRRAMTAPENLIAAVERCLHSEGWISFPVKGAHPQTLTAYLHRVSSVEYDGGVALLAVLLPRQAE